MMQKKKINSNVVGVFSDKYKLIDKNGHLWNATERHPILIYKEFVDFVYESDKEIDPYFDEVMDMFSKME